MLIIDPNGRIPKEVLAAMLHAEKHGACVAGYGGENFPKLKLDLDEIEKQMKEIFLAIEANINKLLEFVQTTENMKFHIRYTIDAFKPIIIIGNVHDDTKVSLTLAGFKDMKTGVWMNATYLHSLKR